MKILQWMIKNIKKVSSDVRTAIVSMVLLVIFGGAAGFLAWSETALNLLTEILKSPTPLWGTITLVLLVFLYLKYESVLSLKLNPLTELVLAEDLKWKVVIQPSMDYEISNVPYCPEHESLLSWFSDGYHCHPREGTCKVFLNF